jgi:SAM-dependent methyltransferase
MSRPLQNKKRRLSPSSIHDTIYAFRTARVLLTAHELDLFTALDAGLKTSAEAARLLRTDERATDRLMNALCAMGYLAKKRGAFSNTPVAACFLVKGKPEYLAGLMHSASLWRTWSTLTDAVRAGTSVMVRGEVNERAEDWLEAFIAAMHARAFQQAPAVVKLLDLRGVRRVLDVGGGSGAFSMAFVRAKKDIHAVVFDLPNVIPLSRKYIDGEHLSDRIDAAVGDYTVDSLGSDFDLAFLSAVIHSNSAEVNKQLFRKVADALNSNGQIVIQDHIMSEDRTAPLAGALFALNMLVGTKAGDTYTESEVRAWMEEAGFKNIRRKGSPLGNSLMIGRKK